MKFSKEDQEIKGGAPTTEAGDGKSRIKERTIAEVIQKVCWWRSLYTGIQKNGQLIKMSLEEAA